MYTYVDTFSSEVARRQRHLASNYEEQKLRWMSFLPPLPFEGSNSLY